MMGAPKFHQHRRIDPRMAQRWREADRGTPAALRRETAELAAALGYPEAAADPAGAALPGAAAVVAPPPSVRDLLAASPAGGFAPRRLPRTGPAQWLPLPHAQERLRVLAHREPASPDYNLPAALA